ncbi:MAG: hypothetical protein ACYDIE_01390 [Candidatus Krumholzibacteriia bacterium]
MPSRMLARYAQILSALVALLTAIPCWADYTLDLPQLLGTHQQFNLSFDLTMPRMSGFTYARLEMSGTQVAGVREDCTRPPYEFPAGAEYRFLVSIPSLPELLFDKAEGYLSADQSEWTVSVPFVPNIGSSVFPFIGTLAAEFAIGQVNQYVICYSYSVVPIVTINMARIVTDGIVGTQSASWGQVMQLYR